MPAAAGIGLRTLHHDEFLERRPPVPWVEVHSENFFGDGGRPLAVLEAVRRDYPVSLHGVGASLGSADEPCASHLARLKRLVDRVQPALVSEHLCWCAVDGRYLNDLLPLPYTAEALALMTARVSRVQEALGRQILVENVSSYLQFAAADFSEGEFLARVAEGAGCGILLDVNNLWVSSRNHGFDPREYLAAIPRDAVAEIHLAGHTELPLERGSVLIDSHSAPVAEPVWALYRQALERFGPVPTLIEWDAELPALEVLVAEARRAEGYLRSGAVSHARVA